MTAEAIHATATADRITFETLISDTSARLLAAPSDEVLPAIDAALAQVMEFFRANRCGLLSVGDDLRRVHVVRAAYSEGVSQVASDVDLGELFPWTRDKLVVERVPVGVTRMDDLPPEAAVDRANWALLRTRSNLTVPIFDGVTISHLIVIHTVDEQREFAPAIVPRLRVLGELMVSALQRKQAFEALRVSEERLSRSAAAAGCGLWELDVRSGQFWVTPETRRLYGLTDEEHPTWSRFLGLVHADDRSKVAARVAEVMDGRGAFEERYRIVRDDGSERWMDVTARRVGSTQLVGASIDVTDRVEAEQLVAWQTARVAAAVDLAEIGFSERSIGNGPAYLDARARDLFGLGPEGPGGAGEQWLARVHPADREPLHDARERLMAGDVQRVAFEYRYEHPARGWIWLRHTSRRDATLDAAGRVRLVEAVQDITERRTREEELRTLRDRLERENTYLRQETARRFGARHVGGRSPAIRRVLDMVEQVAPTNATVLLTGETGTGKERFAQLIHESSPRRGRPMVRVNCSAIPTALIESELFGREKGAYTGAVSKQIGRFEIASGSTLFLDEVSDLPPEVQVKLLRVLQERVLERLGSPRPVEVDVRIVAATNRELEQAVREGRFRSDLFYRLNVFPIVVPPLRERREDIPSLVTDLVEDIGSAMGKRFDAVAKSSMEALQRYDWPGNVRELRNVLERAMILSPGPTLVIDPTVIPSPASMLEARRAPEPSGHLEDVEREYILQVLGETGWRIKGHDSASVRLGMKPSTLYGRMRKLGISR